MNRARGFNHKKVGDIFMASTFLQKNNNKKHKNENNNK